MEVIVMTNYYSTINEVVLTFPIFHVTKMGLQVL